MHCSDHLNLCFNFTICFTLDVNARNPTNRREAITKASDDKFYICLNFDLAYLKINKFNATT